MNKIEKNIQTFIENHRNVISANFNNENFYVHSDDLRYYSFVYRFLFNNVSDVNRIMESIKETKISGNTYYPGIYSTETNVKCIIPERKKLLDEMVSIHELTHLINYLESGRFDDSISKEVIPFFNEYDYAKKIHTFYSDQYLQFRYYKAIEAANRINHIDKDYHNQAYASIYAYLLLKKMKNDYDIDLLNRINSSGKYLEPELQKKGYTLHI